MMCSAAGVYLILMKITFLGTNGWFDSETGHTTCTLVETEKEYIVLDAGSGLYKLNQHITESRPVYIFLSHLHLDHIFGLHALPLLNYPQGIKIICSAQNIGFLKHLLNQPFTADYSKLRTRVEFIGASPGAAGLDWEFFPLRHSVECLGARLKSGGRTLAYGTDTGICDNLHLLARKADLLLAECSFLSGMRNENWPHLNPEDAASVALKAGTGRLALIHFDAFLYKNLKQRGEAEAAAKKIFPNTFASRDDLKIEL